IVSAQLLVSELEPGVSGEELLAQIIKVLSGILNHTKTDNRETISENVHEIQEIIELLESTKEQLLAIDNCRSNDISVYKQLAEKLTTLEVPFELNKLF